MRKVLTCGDDGLRDVRHVFGEDHRHPVLEVPVDVAVEHPRPRVVRLGSGGFERARQIGLRGGRLGTVEGQVDAYLEPDGDIVSDIPDVHGIATDGVDIVGRNLASAANYRERMLCRTYIFKPCLWYS